MAMTVLITGFEPFGADTVNPSWEAVKALPDEIAGARLVKAEIPVVFGKGGEAVGELIRREKPDIVIAVGQAGGRASIGVERVAINCADCAPLPDNAGNVPDGEAICPDGPDAYFATLPVKAIVKKLLDNEIPAQISNSAGTYVCNDVMYRLLRQLHRELPAAKGGFLHVPYAASQRHPQYPSMPLAEITRGLRCCVEAALESLAE